MQADKTAILLFSRSLEAEFKAKSFGLTKERFRLIYRAFLKKTYQTLEAVDLPLFEFNSKHQVGNAFGERLAYAVRQIQERGFSRVIIVGNDAPGLNTEILNTAITQLEQGENILGRDARGGCYLMGFTINEAVLHHLRSVQWHSPTVFEQLNAFLEADTSLPLLVDLNKKEDLKKALLNSGKAKFYLIDLFQRVFSSFFKAILLKISIRKVSLSVPELRGPPALA